MRGASWCRSFRSAISHSGQRNLGKFTYRRQLRGGGEITRSHEKSADKTGSHSGIGRAGQTPEIVRTTAFGSQQRTRPLDLGIAPFPQLGVEP